MQNRQSPTKIGSGARLFWILLLVLLAIGFSIQSHAVMSQVAKANLQLQKGELTLEFFEDEVTIDDGSVEVRREKNIGVNLLAPLTGVASLFTKKNKVKINPLDHTYTRIYGDPDDFGLFSLQAICYGDRLLLARWFFTRLNVNTAQFTMKALFTSGSATIGGVMANQLPWIWEKVADNAHEICVEGSEAHQSLQPFRLKSHVELDPTGIYKYQYDGKRTLKIGWDAARWFDRVEVEAMELSKEILELLKKFYKEQK